jgi:ribosomal-protein-alanine N-acetyltransferase
MNLTESEPPILKTARLIVRMGTYKDVSAIVQYYRSNREFLVPFEPERPEDFYSEYYWQAQVQRNRSEFEFSQSVRLFLFEQAASGTVIGAINFNHCFRGVLQSCVLGYSLAEAKQGQGLMQEALEAAIQFMFINLNFHRILANYMPHNQRSGRLLKRLGFVVEGYARDYLLIAGKWEDHILTSRINTSWKF